MGNPRPTNSKPCKIGRKHNGKPSLRVIGNRMSRAIAKAKARTAKIKKFNAEVAAFWRGERDQYPQSP